MKYGYLLCSLLFSLPHCSMQRKKDSPQPSQKQAKAEKKGGCMGGDCGSDIMMPQSEAEAMGIMNDQMMQ